MYFWLKCLHIAAMTVWFGALCFLPHLFAARARGDRDGRPGYFNPVANILFFRLGTPAALVTVVAGMALMGYGPRGVWLLLKLVVVSAAVLLHVYLGSRLQALGQGRERHGARFYRILGWCPLALLLAVAALTGAKPQTVGHLPPPPAGDAGPRPDHRRSAGAESVAESGGPAGASSWP